MDDRNQLDCKIFVETACSLDDLASCVARAVGGSVGGLPFARLVRFAEGEIEVRANVDADGTRATEFPDGFLYFRTILEFYPSATAERAQCVDVVRKVLRGLWSERIPSVAACDYEAELPTSGYGNTSLPWPTKSASEFTGLGAAPMTPGDTTATTP